ncbi:hypothetical protein [Streptomyces sp. NPDC001515]
MSRIATVVGGAVAATLLSITSSSAITVENDVAGTTVWPSGTGTSDRCGSNSSAMACFRPNGDWFMIVDQKADGHSAVVRWTTYDANTNARHRTGLIWNKGGANAYRYMNKNFAEGDYLEFDVCAGEYGATYVIENTCNTVAAWV